MRYWMVLGYIGPESYGVIDSFDNEEAANECRDWHEKHPSLGYTDVELKVQLVITPSLRSEFIPPMTEEHYQNTIGKEMNDYYARLQAEYDRENVELPED